MQLLLIAGEGRDVGKTLLGEKLVKALTSRGLSVGVVKHVHHGVDYRVKDTGRYLAAGARRVVAVGPDEYMVVEPRRLGLEEAICLVSGNDVVIVEGFRDHVEEVRKRGGCAVFLRRNGAAELWYGDEHVEINGIDAVFETILRLLKDSSCSAAFSCRNSPS
jgi:molybdopterin-guanine dinucleotide biosynthesis protein B